MGRRYNKESSFRCYPFSVLLKKGADRLRLGKALKKGILNE